MVFVEVPPASAVGKLMACQMALAKTVSIFIQEHEKATAVILKKQLIAVAQPCTFTNK